MSRVSSLKKVTIWSLTLEAIQEYKILKQPMIGFCYQQKIWGGEHVMLHIKESKLSLLLSIVSSVPSTRWIHNEYFINKRMKI